MKEMSASRQLQGRRCRWRFHTTNGAWPFRVFRFSLVASSIKTDSRSSLAIRQVTFISDRQVFTAVPE